MPTYSLTALSDGGLCQSMNDRSYYNQILLTLLDTLEAPLTPPPTLLLPRAFMIVGMFFTFPVYQILLSLWERLGAKFSLHLDLYTLYSALRANPKWPLVW